MADLTHSLSSFSRKLPTGHPDRIWLGPLRMLHSAEKHTEAEWRKLIEAMRVQKIRR